MEINVYSDVEDCKKFKVCAFLLSELEDKLVNMNDEIVIRQVRYILDYRYDPALVPRH